MKMTDMQERNIIQAVDDPYFPLEFQTHSSDGVQSWHVTDKSTGLQMASKRVSAHQKTHKIIATLPLQDYSFFLIKPQCIQRMEQKANLKTQSITKSFFFIKYINKCKNPIMGIYFSLSI